MVNDNINKIIDNEVVENDEKQKANGTEKFFITIPEAVELFGIGDDKLRKFLKDNYGAEYLSYNGNRTLIKRKMFEEFLTNNVIVF